MRALFMAAMIALAAAPFAAETAPVANAANQTAEAAVRNFFVAFDARDYPTMERIFTSDATITHDNGVTTDIPTMMKIIRETKDWPPRTRLLSDFRVVRVGSSGLVVTLINKVRFTPSGRPPVENPYNETWVFDSTPDGLKVVRVHYSSITKKAHSEDI